VVAARITESAEAANASEKRLNNRRMTPSAKSGLANHGRYENPSSRQIKPMRKLESPLLNIKVLNPREAMNKLTERPSPTIRGIDKVVGVDGNDGPNENAVRKICNQRETRSV
jgi:hypothetical protein